MISQPSAPHVRCFAARCRK